jgi:hypothetical protein
VPHDYHVVSLTYSVTSGDGVTYDAPPSVEFERDKAHFRLADGILTCRMKVYFSTPAEARSAVDLSCLHGKLRLTSVKGIGGCTSITQTLRLSIGLRCLPGLPVPKFTRQTQPTR